MARTPEAAALTRQHRRLQLAVRAAALHDLQRLWRAVDATNLAETIRPFAGAGAVVVGARRRESTAAALRYFRAFRRLEGLGGEVSVAALVPPSDEVLEAQVRGAAIAGIIRARRSGFSPQAAAMNGFVKAAGSATSLVLGGGRGALISAIAVDRQATGWQRVTSGQPCAFCRMIASRGPVFKTERGASFEAHDHCSCSAEPLYEGSRPLAENERFRQEWDEATAGLSGSEALKEFRRVVEARA